MMDIIYETQGAAREYTPLACNLYTTCTHGCTYCYCPGALHKTPAEFHREGPPKKNVLQRLAKDCAIMAKNKDEREVMLSFVGDPYQSEEAAWMTHQALILLGVHGIKTTVLTKNPKYAERQAELFRLYGISLGVSWVWYDDNLRERFEPGAARCPQRYEALWRMRESGVRTWVSLEPVIDPAQALQVIEVAHEHVGHWKVGIIQHDAKLVAAHDWGKFYRDVTALLDSVGADYYIKESLRKYA